MFGMFFRVAFLLGMMTFASARVFGYTIHETVSALLDLSVEQVEALYDGVVSIGLIQVGFLIVGFLYRRAIILFVKKVATAVTVMLLPTSFRRWFANLLSFPKAYGGHVWGRMNHWYDRRLGVELANWFRAFKYSLALFLLAATTFELVLALVREATLLPPIVLKYKAKIFATAIAFVLGSVAQTFLLVLSAALFGLLPTPAQQWLRHRRIGYVRLIIRLRYRYLTRRTLAEKARR